MANYQPRQALTGWPGDVASLLAEMKRQAGVRTDRDLARFMGVAQSTVAYWRTRRSVPESAILKFERMAITGGEKVASRVIGARMIAFRLAEFYHQRLATSGLMGGRQLTYSFVALTYHTITDAAYQQLRQYEEHTGQDALQIAGQLIDDEVFLSRMLDWAKKIPADVGLAREGRAPLSLPSEESPQQSPQSADDPSA